MVKFLSKEEDKEIIEAIGRAEKGTSGEIRVHLRKKCKKDALTEAHQIFRKLGMHRVKEKNAVLIFVAPESRQFAIVGDSGIHEKVKDEFWHSTPDLMAGYFKQGKIKEGIIAGIHSAGEKLKHHFPAKTSDSNQLTGHQITRR